MAPPRTVPQDLFAEPFRFDSDPTGYGIVRRQTDRQTLAGKVADLFKSRPAEWIDGRDIMQIAGAYGWRTRISDVRRGPYFLNIENRQRREGGFTVSEYRLLPSQYVDEIGGAA